MFTNLLGFISRVIWFAQRDSLPMSSLLRSLLGYKEDARRGRVFAMNREEFRCRSILHSLSVTLDSILEFSVKVSDRQKLYRVINPWGYSPGYTLALPRPNKALLSLIKTHIRGEKRTPWLLPLYKDQQWSI